MFYRLRQFWLALFPKIEDNELDFVKEFLSEPAFNLFLRQSPVEQRHALDVALDLRTYKNYLSKEDFSNLITAALLHDCGKSLINIRLWQRVYIVLVSKAPNMVQQMLANSCIPLSLPLRIASVHPILGEYLAKKTGQNKIITSLIREHHSPETELGKLLYEADNRH